RARVLRGHDARRRRDEARRTPWHHQDTHSTGHDEVAKCDHRRARAGSGEQPARRRGVRMSRLSRDELFDLAAAYALGATTPEESAEIEAAMPTSPQLAAEVASFREVTAELAKIKTVAPSPAIRERLMRRAR